MVNHLILSWHQLRMQRNVTHFVCTTYQIAGSVSNYEPTHTQKKPLLIISVLLMFHLMTNASKLKMSLDITEGV